ncbi:unnamed protein product [Pylaiella littoralis]
MFNGSHTAGLLIVLLLAIMSGASATPTPASTTPAPTAPSTPGDTNNDIVSSQSNSDASTHTPGPAPSTPEGEVSCGVWECDAGFSNVMRDCFFIGWDGAAISTDGYTSLGNLPVCDRDVCCEPTPTPAPTTPAPTVPSTPGDTNNDIVDSCESWDCGAGFVNVVRDCFFTGSNGAAVSSDGWTSLGDLPICDPDVCCEQTPTPAPTALAPTTPAQMCSDGTEGIDGNGIVCCPIDCNQCGGSGCSSSGAAAGLGASQCCGKAIKASDAYCDVTNEAPCIIGSAPVTQLCTDGTEGISGNGVVCCPIGCNQCAGKGCDVSGAAAGLGASECCGGAIKASGVFCVDTNEAPCIL